MQQQAPLHVLVVEDEVVNRDMVCQILNYFGHRVSAVDNGAAALCAVREGGHDIVLMDCRMLDMDGLETTRRLRAGEGGPCGITVPVIALTAQAFTVDRDACLAAGMNDFLTKPVDIDHLALAVERWGRHQRCREPSCTCHTDAVSAPARSTEAVFDQTVLAALPMVVDGSQPDYGRIVLDLYFKSLPAQLNAIEQAAGSGDMQTAQRTAHSLKSSSAAVGALAMAAYAGEAEAQLRQGNGDMSCMPTRFDVEYRRLCAMLGRLPYPIQESAVRSC